MNIVFAADIHGRYDRLESLVQTVNGTADVLLLGGDLTHFGGAEAFRNCRDVLEGFSGQIFGVSGNCDYPQVAVALDEAGFGLEGKCRVFDGVSFFGLGGSLPCPGTTPNEFSESQIAELLTAREREIDESLPLVVVSHQPPLDSGADRILSGKGVGSRSLREFLLKRCPSLCFCGHIHESPGVFELGSTRVVNPGPLMKGRYAQVVLSERDVEVRLLKQC